MRRVLLVQPSLQPPGGGNGVAAWILQALVSRHRVTVLSWHPVDVGPINRFFGTSLQSSDFDRVVVPRAWTVVPDHLPVPAALIRLALLMRYTRRVSDAFDVIVGGYNETDYGRRGIQYVNYPTYLRPRPEVDLRWYHRSDALLQSYYALADRLAGFSFERMKSNVTLANSNWTAAKVRRLLGIEAQTVYPPVVEAASTLPWDQRQPSFLAIGRMSPEKEYERIIRILARARTVIPGITLTIVCTTDRHARRYDRRVRSLAASLGSWISFRDNLPRDDVRSLMASYRYGIHGMREEHFGLAPAEMARAGMIVWVPDGGGQVEIVGGEPVLVYGSEEEAADRIACVVTIDAEQQRLRELLASRSELFTTERFVDRIREVVETFSE